MVLCNTQTLLCKETFSYPTVPSLAPLRAGLSIHGFSYRGAATCRLSRGQRHAFARTRYTPPLMRLSCSARSRSRTGAYVSGMMKNPRIKTAEEAKEVLDPSPTGRQGDEAAANRSLYRA